MKPKRKKSRKKQPGASFFLALRLFSLFLIAVCLLILVLFFREVKVHKQEQEEILHAQEDFIRQLLPLAQENYETYGILPSITLSQAILESDWGRSRLSSEFHNYFGIKSFKESENRVSLQTQEFYNDRMNTVRDYFRVYESLEASVAHHGLLLGTAPRYSKFLTSSNYKEASQALYEASYSTDPNYPQKLNYLIETYRLDQYDPPATE